MTKPTHYVFHAADGRILRVVYCKPAERAANAPAGLDWIEAARAPDPAVQYVAGGAIAARPTQASTLVDTLLANLPDSCEIVIEGTRYPLSGGMVELYFGLPGTYRVTVEAFPYLPAHFEVINP